MGPKELVDDTWRAPLHKIVVARWLLELGETLGCHGLTYIPNAVEERYRIIRPIEQRPRRVAMISSFVPLKGSRERFSRSINLRSIDDGREQLERELFHERGLLLRRIPSILQQVVMEVNLDRTRFGAGATKGAGRREMFPVLQPAQMWRDD